MDPALAGFLMVAAFTALIMSGRLAPAPARRAARDPRDGRAPRLQGHHRLPLIGPLGGRSAGLSSTGLPKSLRS
jgi:hypothetical protein